MNDIRAPSESEARFALLDAQLERQGLQVELCLVGGAVIPLVFHARPHSRRPRDLFAPKERLDALADGIGARMELPAGWIGTSVRSLVGSGGGGGSGGSGSFGSFGGGLFEGRALRVYGAQPAYVLAMRCAALAHPPDEDTARDARSDVAYLLRFLGVRSAVEALTVLAPYLNERQRPAELEELFDEIIV